MTDSPVLARLVRDLQAAGVVGVDLLAMLIYLCNISRLLAKPQSYLLTGPSASGKSFLAQCLINLVPPDDVERFDSASDTALFYKAEPLTHKIVYVPETATLTDDVQSYLRVLVSEGSLTRDYTILRGVEREVRHVERNGPCLVAQTSVESVHPENETRALMIEVPDSHDQTRRVMQAIARQESGATSSMPIAHWRDFDLSLPRTGASVEPRLAVALADLVDSRSVRMRRDFRAILTLMGAHAILYSAERARDGAGLVVADMGDYAIVRSLILSIVAVQIEASVSSQVREFVVAVARLTGDIGSPDTEERTVTAKAVGETIGLDARTAWRRAKASLKGEFLINLESRPRQPSRLKLGRPMPADVEPLPPVDVLADAVSSQGDAAAVDTSRNDVSTDSMEMAYGDVEQSASAEDPAVSRSLSTLSTLIGGDVHATVSEESIGLPPKSFDDIFEQLMQEAGEEP